jgi:hypothetical protein
MANVASKYPNTELSKARFFYDINKEMDYDEFHAQYVTGTLDYYNWRVCLYNKISQKEILGNLTHMGQYVGHTYYGYHALNAQNAIETACQHVVEMTKEGTSEIQSYILAAEAVKTGNSLFVVVYLPTHSINKDNHWSLHSYSPEELSR